MAKAAVKKIPHDIEYRVLGNAFGLLIALGGLLPGAMVSQRSFRYWQEDIVPLALLAFMGYRLFTGFMDTMTAYRDVPHHPLHHREPPHEHVQSDQAVVAQLAAPKTPNYTDEQVVEEVVKRIEAQKAEKAKKNKS